MLRRFLLVLLGVMIGSTAHAYGLSLGPGMPLCHAVTPVEAKETPASFDCKGTPRDYQDRLLWLRADLRGHAIDPDGQTLLIHQTRFDDLLVRFAYADGVEREQHVHKGAFGAHWRAGGQINFYVPQRDAPLTSVTLRFDHLSSFTLLRANLLNSNKAARNLMVLTLIVGGTLTLLLLSAIYNILLAFAVRRHFIAWHAAWAGCVFLWGLFWSQTILWIAPGVAGTHSAQAATFLSSLAITCATMCASFCLGSRYAPRWVRLALLILAVMIGGLGIAGGTMTGSVVELLDTAFGYVIISILVMVTGSVAIAWRKGSIDARDFALAWAPPMFVLGLSQAVNLKDSFFGGGAQIAVLFASALQTMWLSIAISLRLANMRYERDAARREQEMMRELALRDSLTSLLNRRGFTAIVSRWFDECRGTDARLSLLIIDVDHFKEINDRLGHDAGDRVLQDMARRLTQWESDQCCTGRLGGEEFTVAVRNMDQPAFHAFADEVRRGLSTIGHRRGDPIGRATTVSIGAAELRDHPTFNDLYRAADEALYAAKGAGRNRVAIADPRGCTILGEHDGPPETRKQHAEHALDTTHHFP